MNIPCEYKLAELFCGPGGIALGALLSKITAKNKIYSIQPAWANDIDEDTCRTYAANIKKLPLEDVRDSVVCADVRNIKDFKSINFNALAFGFPCNDFSAVGETKGFHGEYGPLYTNGVRMINAKNPLWFLAENVGGLRNANDGTAFETILHDLEHSGKHGYNLKAHLYCFEKYGIPQARHRIIIVGIRNDLKLKFKVPKPITPNPVSQKTCRDAIENPPVHKNAGNNETTKQSKVVIDRLMCLPPGENAWFLDKVMALSDINLKNTMLGISTFRQHFPGADSASKIRGVIERVKLNVKSARMSHIYKRLDPARPSYTVTGSGGGGTHVYHWSEPRALTNRERARLQTFPDEFLFFGSKESARKQIGMAVPPDGVKHIFTAILKTMAGEEYKFDDANLYDTNSHVLKIDALMKDKEL